MNDWHVQASRMPRSPMSLLQRMNSGARYGASSPSAEAIGPAPIACKRDGTSGCLFASLIAARSLWMAGPGVAAGMNPPNLGATSSPGRSAWAIVGMPCTEEDCLAQRLGRPV